MIRNRRVSSKTFWPGITCMILIVTYAPNVFFQYAWSDDYTSMVETHEMAIHALKDLRTLGAAWHFILFNAFGNIDNLWIIRLVGLLLLCVTSCVYFQILNSKLSNTRSMLITLVVLNAPPVIISVYWATGVVTTISALAFSSLGSLLLIKKHDSIKGLLLVIASYSIYPLSALAALSMIFFRFWILSVNEKRVFFRIAATHFLCATISFFLGIAYLWLAQIPPSPRTQILFGTSFRETFLFLFTHHVPLSWRTIDSSSEFVTLFIETIALFLLALFAIIQYRGKFSKALIDFVSINTLLVLLISPLILSGYNQIELRFYLGGSILCLSCICLLRLPIKNETVLHFTSLVIIVSLICFNSLFFRTKIAPIVFGTKSFIESQLKSCDKKNLSDGVQVISRKLAFPSRPEIGMLSQSTDLASSWVPLNAVIVFLESQGDLSSKANILSVDQPSLKGCKIDLNDYRSLRE